MHWYTRVEGVLIEPMGAVWAAFSPSSGETSLLNDESAAILELLEHGGATTNEVCSKLTADVGLATSDLLCAVEDSWGHLIDAGLVHVMQVPKCAPS